MCEECGPTPPHIKEAFEEFEEAIKTFQGKIGDSSGIMVDWTLVVAKNHIFTHTDSTTTDSYSGLNQPQYRTIGLLDLHLTQLKADLTARE